MTLQETYTQREEAIKEQIELLQAKLIQHKKDFKNKPNNWGFAGDLGHVLDTITNLNKSIITSKI